MADTALAHSRPLAVGKRDLSVAWIASSPILVVAVMAWMLGEIAVTGVPRLSLGFLLEAPVNAGRDGGIAPILVSTFLIVAVCLCTALPLALGTAVLIAEFLTANERVARIIQALLDTCAAVPSIIFGIFGYAFFAEFLGMGLSILTGGLTLCAMILPILIGSIEQSLRAIPVEFRLAAAGLGMTRPEIVARILLPMASPGILAGVLLSVGRALAETAALIFTSGYVTRMPESLSDSGRTLAIHIYDLSMNVPGGTAPAAATTVVLVAALFVLNGGLIWIVRLWHRRTGMSLALCR